MQPYVPKTTREVPELFLLVGMRSGHLRGGADMQSKSRMDRGSGSQHMGARE